MARRWKVSRSRVPSLPADTAPLLSGAVEVLGKTPAELYSEQPHLRTVVDFLARNIARLGLHVYQRGEDGSRERLRDHPLAALLGRPNEQTTTYEFVYALVAGLALHGRQLVWVIPGDDGLPGELRPIPESWIADTEGSTAFAVGAYVLAPDSDSGSRITVPASEVIELHGWNPADPRIGSSPVEALRGALAEQIHAQSYRSQQWSNGGRVGSYITRPADAAKWSNEGRARFKRGWTSTYAGDRAVGGTPVLEDGMELKRIGFSAKEDDYVAGTKLGLATVAQVYGVNPVMVGLNDESNYSNVREFNRQLYGGVLGPIIKQISERLNADLVSRYGDAGIYVEFDTRSALEGDHEGQISQYVAAVTAGLMTRNEVRAMLNKPALPGGDELLTPLNLGVAEGNTGENQTEQ